MGIWPNQQTGRVFHTLSKLMFGLFGLSYPFWTIGCVLGAGLLGTDLLCKLICGEGGVRVLVQPAIIDLVQSATDRYWVELV